MSLTERHRWCMGKIVETFGSELDKEVLEGWMRTDTVLSKFSSFFRGESSGRLFVFYQPETVDGEVRFFYLMHERFFPVPNSPLLEYSLKSLTGLGATKSWSEAAVGGGWHVGLDEGKMLLLCAQRSLWCRFGHGQGR